MIDDDDAAHAARAVLGGRPLSLNSEEVFARLNANPHVSRRELDDARRLFGILELGKAVEAVNGTVDGRSRKLALLRLARELVPHLSDRSPGWFRFIITMGSRRSWSPFQLDLVRRVHSTAAQPQDALSRSTHTRQAMNDMLTAGSILSRVGAAAAQSLQMPIQAAIEDAKNDGEIATDEEAARKAFQRFRNYCARLTGGGDTYRLIRYSGPIKKFKDRWVAVPEIGRGSSRLPSAKGGRPKT